MHNWQSKGACRKLWARAATISSLQQHKTAERGMTVANTTASNVAPVI
jgi:hypothetical protein